jgi:hypothetical protein
MDVKLLGLLMLLALLIAGNPASGEEPLGRRPKKARTPEDYTARTLKEVAAKTVAAADKEKEDAAKLVLSDLLPSRARAIYTGRTRPLPVGKSAVLDAWARRYAGSVEHYTKHYDTEALFKENGAEHWLAVRKDLLPPLQQTLKAGDAADLSLIRMGAAKTAAGWEPLLLVEGFEKTK